MSKLVFASDIDGCVLRINGLLVDYFSEKLNKKIKYEDIHDYNIEDVIEGITKEDVLNAFNFIISKNHLGIEEGGKEIISWLSALSSRDMLFFTSRNPSLENRTYENLLMYFSDIDFIVFHERDSIKKEDYIKKYNVNLFIEDDVNTALDIVANTQCTVLLMDRPWNRKVDIKNIKNIYRVKNWIEVRDFVYEKYCR